jgi:uncharacterized protein YlaN (UPF0358 family)|tara:strand:+ start:72 stop:209 length:138 start_codon:yes stop_codon:yes gene_type:complete
MVKNYIELMSEEDLKELQARVKHLRMQMLFEEPCPLYEEVEDATD